MSDPEGTPPEVNSPFPSGTPESQSCPLCARPLVLTDSVEVNGRTVCGACGEQIVRELEAQNVAPNWPVAIAAGVAGALIGAAVWAGIAVYTGFEVGYVAVLVGFLAGFGVKLGAGQARGPALQVAAAGIAVAGLVAAKYLTMVLAINKLLKEQGEATWGWFDSRFTENFGSFLGEAVGGFDILWVILAVLAAHRVPKRTAVALQR